MSYFNRHSMSRYAPAAAALASSAMLACAAPQKLAAPSTVTSPSSARSSRARLPDVVLTTQDNEKVRFYADLVSGKTVLINFMYAHCNGSCPGVTANLVRVQKALGDRVGRDVFLYSITLDPVADDAASLRAYAKAVGAGPGWKFLTGSPADIELLRRALGATDPDPIIDADKTQHAAMVVYGNDRLDRWAGIPGLLSVDQIKEAVLRVVDPR